METKSVNSSASNNQVRKGSFLQYPIKRNSKSLTENDKQPGYIISVEGFDGSGKSTIAQSLSILLGAILYRTPSGNFREARQHFDKDLSDPSERISFYLGSCIDLSFKLQVARNAGKISVIDRYYYSTISYHYKFPEIINAIKPICIDHLIQPNLIIYINPDFNTISSRLTARGPENSDLLFLSEEYHKRIDLEYRALFNTKVISHPNEGCVNSTVSEVMKSLLSVLPVQIAQQIFVHQQEEAVL